MSSCACVGGKATREWCSRGFRVVALEPDGRMAEVARRTAPGHTTVEVVESTFEDWDADARRFSLVAAAQSWHWVDPEAGFTKARDVLGDRGWLVLFWNHPVDRGGALAAEIDAVYARLVPAMRSRFAGSRQSKTEREWPDQLRAHGFEDVAAHRYRWDSTYRTREYLALMTTHSDHRLLEAGPRSELLPRSAAPSTTVAARSP